MLSARVLTLLTKLFVIVLGVILGWLYANSFETPVESKYMLEKVQSIDSNVVFPTVIPDDVEVATKLAEKVRLLCLVPTRRNQHKEDATSLKNTWGWHCNKLLFVTNEFDEYINDSIAIAYTATGKDEKPWHKLKYALQHVYGNYDGEFDWILKTELNNYAIVENVRYMLHNYSSAQANVVGRLASPAKIDDNSAYVLSREAVRRLAVDAFNTGNNCSSDQNVNNEFTKISECLVEIQSNFVKSQDAHGRELFLKDHVSGTINSLKSRNDFRKEVSNFTAVWPKAGPHDLHILNFFVYEMRSYGAPQEMPPL